MMEFYVRTYGNRSLNDAILKHGKRLGYNFRFAVTPDSTRLCWTFWKSGAVDPFASDYVDFLSLDYFFQLTQDDVRGTRTMTLDGKQIPLSEESYQALKKHFNEGSAK